MLTPIALFHQSSRKRWKILCVCDCGKIKDYEKHNLMNLRNQHCGCLRHGEGARAHRTPEYISWMNMRLRCTSISHKHFPNYGGRGISICERWKNYKNFLSDMGRKPSPAHSIDRINNDGNYEPGNCRWATRIQQRANQRPPKP